ncbi:MAG: DUF456 domain-containing protein [bacterium]
MTLLGTLLFFLVLLFGIASLLFGLPGTVIILLAAAVWAWASGFREITGGMLLVLAALTLFGEISDYLFGILGARRYGSSGGGIAFSIAGGLVGAVIGAPFLFGLGAVLGAFAGAFAGAVLYELFSYGCGQWRQALRSGWGNFLGRVMGMITKVAIAVGMVVWIAVTLL